MSCYFDYVLFKSFGNSFTVALLIDYRVFITHSDIHAL